MAIKSELDRIKEENVRYLGVIPLSQVKKNNVISALTRKGFKEYSSNKDHLYFHFVYEGKEYPIWTKISHGSGYADLGNPLIALMAKQMMLSKQQFLDFVKCQISKEAYIQILKENGDLQ